jgi:hypothetical protein
MAIVETTTGEFIAKVTNKDIAFREAKAMKVASWITGYFVNNMREYVLKNDTLAEEYEMRLPTVLFEYNDNDDLYNTAIAMVPGLLKKKFSDAEFTVSWTVDTVWLCKSLHIKDYDQIVVDIRVTWPF